MPGPSKGSPAAVDAGRRGARKRWAGHAPRTIRLDGLPDEQRAFLAELIETARRNAQPVDPAA